MLTIIFWFSIITVFYIYFGYPLILAIFSKIIQRTVKKGANEPTISLLIAAYNEEKVIEAKIENSLELDYPREKLQIIVVSDASTDGTDEIVKKHEKDGIVLSRQTKRTGKSIALNFAVSKFAVGKILVFTDATTRIDENALLEMAKYYDDPDVGALCGNLKFETKRSENENIYWRYEQLLRKMEGELGCLPFVTGAFYSIRRDLYSGTPEGMPDDSNSPLSALKEGKMCVFAEDAVAFEIPAKRGKDILKVKVRGIVRELSSIFYNRKLLDPFKYLLASFILINHRILRYSVPFLLILILAANFFLSLTSVFIYKAIFAFQIMFYGAALLKLSLGSRVQVRLISLPYYFCLINYAAFVGVIQFLFGKKYTTWEPVR